MSVPEGFPTVPDVVVDGDGLSSWDAQDAYIVNYARGLGFAGVDIDGAVDWLNGFCGPSQGFETYEGSLIFWDSDYEEGEQ